MAIEAGWPCLNRDGTLRLRFIAGRSALPSFHARQPGEAMPGSHAQPLYRALPWLSCGPS